MFLITFRPKTEKSSINPLRHERRGGPGMIEDGGGRITGRLSDKEVKQ